MDAHIYPGDAIQDALNSAQFLRAFELSAPFAHRGNPEAQTIQGLLYQMGLGVAVNGERAVKWYLLASDQNHPVACNNLGTIYTTALPGVPIDKRKAHHFFDKAHEYGFPGMELPGILNTPSLRLGYSPK